MFRRYRQRRGPYALAAPSVLPSVVRSLLLLGIVLLVLFFVGRWILALFGGSDHVRRDATLLTVEDRGTVNVSLEGGLMQRAEDRLKLYPGDRVTTGSNSHAQLTLLDGSRIRLDATSDATLNENTRGEQDSETDVTVSRGAAWIRTPNLETFSGSIVRTIRTDMLTLLLPADTEVVVDVRGLMVFSADGEGIAVEVKGSKQQFFIGEGQQWTLPENAEVTGDLLRFRSALEALAVQRAFVEESRALGRRSTQPDTTGTVPLPTQDILTVTNPIDNATITTPTVKVEGTIGSRVDKVRVNSYLAAMNPAQGTFSQELSLRDGEEITIRIEALDKDGIALEQQSRTVRRGTVTVDPPAITSPAKGGETWRTQQTEVEIKGTPSARAAGIMVNDYRLQLFRAGDASWGYLASTALQNLHPGQNIFEVFALDANGNKSNPVRLTVLVEEGTPGVVGGAVSSTSSTPAPSEAALPTNAPLKPGTITVTAPATGATYTATGSEFVLEGTTIPDTASVWVNGYKLQLYRPGRTVWNYIAKVDYGTLKRGTNVYHIVTRNAEQQILDAFDYTVTYNP